MPKGSTTYETKSEDDIHTPVKDEKQAVEDRIAIVKDLFEKNKTLDKKDQKEISREDMILAGLIGQSS